MLRLAAFLVGSLIALFLGFFLFDTPGLENAFRLLGYPTILILTLGYLTLVCIDAKPVTANWIRKPSNRFILLGCLLATIYLYSREGGGFKIFFDEHVLSNVALNLHKSHLPVIRESSLIDIASYETIDKRPLLYPFLLSVVHDVTGFRPENAFYLNFAITFFCLVLVFNILRQISSKTAAIYAVLLACFFPLFSQNASGGGFEMLNLLCMLACTWHAISFWRDGSERDLTKLLIAATLASHVRYESALILLPVAALVIARWIRERRFELPIAAIALPFFFLTLAWQFNYIKEVPAYWQYSLEGESSFQLSYLPINLQHAFNFLFIPDPEHASSPFVSFTGIAGLAFILVFGATRFSQLFNGHPERIAAAVMALYLLAQTLLVLCFTFGQLDNFIVSRLGFPLALLLVCCGGILLGFLHQSGKLQRYAAIAMTVLAGFYASKMYSRAEYTNANGLKARVEWALEFAHDLPSGNYLFISSMPRIFELENINNLSISIARNNAEKIAHHLELMTYDAVYVIEHGAINLEEDGTVTKTLIPFSDLGPAFIRETIAERSLLAHNFTRISKVVGFDPTAYETLPEPHQASQDANPLRFNLLPPEQYREWQRSLP